MGYSPWGHKESDRTEWINNNKKSFKYREVKGQGVDWSCPRSHVPGWVLPSVFWGRWEESALSPSKTASPPSRLAMSLLSESGLECWVQRWQRVDGRWGVTAWSPQSSLLRHRDAATYFYFLFSQMLAHSGMAHLSLSPTTQARGPGHGEGLLGRREHLSPPLPFFWASVCSQGASFQTQLEAGMVKMVPVPVKVCKP